MRCAYCDNSTSVDYVDSKNLKFCVECYNALRNEKIQELRQYIENNFGCDLPDSMVDSTLDIGQHTLEQLYRDEWDMGPYETIEDLDHRIREENRIERLQDDWRDKGLGII